MSHQKIVSTKGGTLYKGAYETFKECLESAIDQGIELGYADLKNLNLTNLSADGADLEFADFSGSNLSGANLSEGLLHGCNFEDTSLYNTCLAYSDISFGNFKNTSFGATNITGCDVSYSLFSTLSCFTLDFIQAQNMMGCRFESADGTTSMMSRPPVIINGYDAEPIVFFDKDIRRGHEKMDAKKWIGVFNYPPPKKKAA